MSSELVIEKYEINYLDRNSSLETVLFNQTFEKFRERYINIEKCLAFNESKNMYLLLNYSPRYRISVIYIYIILIPSVCVCVTALFLSPLTR